jgi:hypothetical protein
MFPFVLRLVSLAQSVILRAAEKFIGGGDKPRGEVPPRPAILKIAAMKRPFCKYVL